MERLAIAYTNMISNYFTKSELELKKIKLGIEILLINISKFIIIMTVAYNLNLASYTILGILLLGLMRLNCFGLHAKNSIVCTLVSGVSLIFISYISKYCYLKLGQIALMGLINLIIIAKYAPADTEAHPLVGEELRKKLKIKAIITIIVIYCIGLIINKDEIIRIIVLMASLQCVLIHPVTYKIFRRGWRNYEKYEN